MFNKDMVLADMIAATKMLKNNDYLHMLNKPPVKRPNTTAQTHNVRDFTGKSNFFSHKAQRRGTLDGHQRREQPYVPQKEQTLINLRVSVDVNKEKKDYEMAEKELRRLMPRSQSDFRISQQNFKRPDTEKVQFKCDLRKVEEPP